MLAAVLLGSPAAAQEPAATVQTEAPAPADDDGELLPDLEITATVQWKQLRFDAVGEPTVEFTGTPDRKTIWDAERINLPKPVQPGVVYRDGGIRLTISSMFAALSRLYTTPEAPRP